MTDSTASPAWTDSFQPRYPRPPQPLVFDERQLAILGELGLDPDFTAGFDQRDVQRLLELAGVERRNAARRQAVVPTGVGRAAWRREPGMSSVLGIRLDRGERLALEQYALDEGVPPSALARMFVRRGLLAAARLPQEVLDGAQPDRSTTSTT